MRAISPCGAALAACLALAGGCSRPDLAPDAAPPPLEFVEGFAVLEPGVAASGQPDDATLQSLASYGYRSVVNLRLASEDPSPIEEGPRVRNAGLEYAHIPMSGGDFTVEQAKALGAVIDDPARRPVLVHCRSGRRVHVLYALYRVTQKGVPIEEAIEAARPFGVQGPLEERVRELAAAAAVKG